MYKLTNNKDNFMHSLNISEKNGAVSYKPSDLCISSPHAEILLLVWEKSCLCLAIQYQKHQSFCVVKKKKKDKKKINPTALSGWKAYQQGEQRAQS